MIKNILVFMAIILHFGCENYEFYFKNLNTEQFVQQLKNETYSEYEIGENGKPHWTKMPVFKW